MVLDYFDPGEVQRFTDALWSKWDREVTVFRQPFGKRLATKDEYWTVLKGWGDDARAGKMACYPKWIEHQLLPSDADASVDAFCERVHRADPADWYLYVTDGVQRYSPLVWHRVTEILRSIIERTGEIPPGGFMLDLFLGRYDRTPSGIHRDDADTLAFVMHGTKRLYFWPREQFQNHDRWVNPARTHYQTGIWDYEKHLDSAIKVEANPGDIIYWPRGYYHIGSSDDHWSGMITLGMWWFASPERAVRHMVQALTGGDSEAVHYPVKLDDLSGAITTLPPALASASAAMRAKLERGWNHVQTEAWARLISGYGFIVPPAKAAPVTAARYMVRHPIAVIEMGGRHVVYACGHNVGATPSATLAHALRTAARGQTIEAGAFEAEASELLAALGGVGAIVAIN